MLVEVNESGQGLGREGVGKTATQKQREERKGIFGVSLMVLHCQRISMGSSSPLLIPYLGGGDPILFLFSDSLSRSCLRYSSYAMQCVWFASLIVIIMRVTFLQTLGRTVGKEWGGTQSGRVRERTQRARVLLCQKSLWPWKPSEPSQHLGKLKLQPDFKVPCYLLYSCTE